MNSMTRTLAIALAVSVGLHLFFAGLWVGGRWRMHDGPMGFGAVMPGHHGGMGLGAMFHDLPPEVGEQLKEQMRANIPQISDHLRVERAVRQKVRDALAADPFVPDALIKSLAELRVAETKRREAAHAAFADIAQKLTPEQRALMRRGFERLGRDRAQGFRGNPGWHEQDSPSPSQGQPQITEPPEP